VTSKAQIFMRIWSAALFKRSRL